MSISSNVAPTGLMSRYTAVQERLAYVDRLTRHARCSLRLWRWVFYSVGLAAVVTAAAAGASSLGDIWGSNATGFLALAAAILASVDNSSAPATRSPGWTAAGRASMPSRAGLASILIDARMKESLLDAGDDAAVSAYDAWLTERCGSVDSDLAVINDRRDQV
jgi:hypothetical protein